MHWDREPTPNNSEEATIASWIVPLPGGVRGGLVGGQFIESLL